MKHFLITGGAGYLGSSLVRAIVARGDRVRRLFRGDKTPEPSANEQIEDFQGDISSRADLERALVDIDVILHLAAQTSIYVADADPLADLEANVRPMLSLLEACRARGGCPTLILASTATLAIVSAVKLAWLLKSRSASVKQPPKHSSMARRTPSAFATQPDRNPPVSPPAPISIMLRPRSR